MVFVSLKLKLLSLDPLRVLSLRMKLFHVDILLASLFSLIRGLGSPAWALRNDFHLKLGVTC